MSAIIDPERDVVGRACCIAAPFVFGVLGVVLGQDSNWDLRNYHWYNPYAWLNGRDGLDLDAAQTPTFYNPLLDVPLFVLAQHAPAQLCSFLVALLHGFNFIVLYALARVLAPEWAKAGRGAVGALIAALGVTGGGAFGIVGTTFYDNVLSLFFSSALWLIARALQRGVLGRGTLAAAGLLAGAAVGLKLPTATYALGLAIACATLPGSLATRFARTTTFGGAAFVGVIAFGGFWMLHLWLHYGNPVFPYFNDVIGSTMALEAHYRDVRFVPTSFTDALLLPFRSSFDPYLVGEVFFRDLRILLLIVAGIATALVATLRAPRTRVAPPVGFALAAAAASYVVWMVVFGVYRYVVTLEMLAPVLTAALIAKWPIATRARIAVALASALLLALSTSPSYWGRIPFGDRFVEVTAPALREPGPPMVVMAGYAPLAWVIPSFPAAVPFVRLQGYGNELGDAESGLTRLVRARVENHPGSFYLLVAADEVDVAREVLAEFDLAADFAACEPIDGNLDGTLRFCPVRRVGAPG